MLHGSRLSTSWLISAILLGTTAAAWAEAAGSQPAATPVAATRPVLRALMFVGGNAHDYDALPHRLADSLSNNGDIQVRVTHEQTDFNAQVLADTDVMVFNCCFEKGLAEPQRKAILDALGQKKGLVLMHCAVWSFQDWPAWGEIVGGMFDKHDPFGPFESIVVDRGHPITRGVPQRFTLADEAYTMKDFTGDRHALVIGVKPHGGHAEPEPFSWTSRYLGARVFTILYGHDDKAQSDPAFLPLLANGIRWAAGRLGPATMLSDLERNSGFVPLFDGKTLEGWHFYKRFWEVRDGMIVGRTPADCKKKSYATYEKPFGDFVLRYEIRLVRGNSGVQFRSRQLPDYEVAGYQADAAPKAWGNLHEQNGRRRLVDGWWHKGEFNVDLSGWNEQEITAQGDHIVLKLNGVVTADYTEKDSSVPRTGIIALQLHDDPNMEVHFTNIRIKPLDGK